MRLHYLRESLCALFFFASLLGVIAQEVHSPFSTIEKTITRDAEAFVSRSMEYKFSLESISEPLARSREKMVLEIPTLTKSKIIELERVQLLAGTYELLTETSIQESNASTYKFYRGKVQGISNSNVGLSIMNDVIHMIIHDEDGSYEIKKVEEEKDHYLGFYTEEIKQKNYISCETDTGGGEGNVGDKENEVQRSDQLDCVEIYLEIDYKAFEKKGSSLSATEGWALAILSQVAVFYDDAGIPITVSGIKVYTTEEADPYTTASNTSEALTAFRNNLNTLGFNGRLAHLMSGRGLGGGRAHLNVLCSNTYNYGVSGNLSSGGTTYSSYTWNINVIAHEIGHNFGSRHTHDCVWNGNNTQIDDCGNKWLINNNYSAGSCYDSEDEILPGNNGTIMSYCHAAGGGSINLNLGFHPQVRDVIYSNYAATNCSGSEVCVGVPPSNNICADAFRLTPTRACNPGIYDNLYATSSGATPEFECDGSIGEKDVWFVVKVPENGLLTLETTQLSGGLSDLVMQVYSGACTALIANSCSDNDGSNNHSKIDIDNITLADQDVLIRIVEKNDVEGEFGFCAYSALLPCSDVPADLIDFYMATGGDSWSNNEGWAEGQAGTNCSYCDWYGITCNASEQITAISLPNNNLSGILDNSLLNLDKLETLDVSLNNLVGSLDEIFVNPLNLKYLNIEENNLQGSIPQFLIDAAKLESLNAGGNNLSGDLPAFTYSSKITFLALDGNDFSGCYPSTYTRFFSSAELDVSGNDELPFMGDFYTFSLDYSGFDFDKDGFCFNIDDCVDFNNTVYDGAPELCDGLDNDCDDTIDEGLDSGPNIWIGPSSLGKWNVNSNWSMGHAPKACEDVELGMNGGTFEIDSSGTVNYYEQYVKSLCIGPNTVLDLQDNFSLYVKNGYVLNMGILNINGYTSFTNLDPSRNGIENSGILTIKSGNYVSISKSGINGLYNKAGGVVNNYGTLRIDSNQPINGNAGIMNEHIINNSGYIDIRGDFINSELTLKTGSVLNNTGRITVGGESFGEGGN